MSAAPDDWLALGDTGATRFRLPVGPLDYVSWSRLQSRLMAPHVNVGRLRRALTILGVATVFGGGAGVAIAAYDLDGLLTVVSLETGSQFTLEGAELMFLALALGLFVYVATVLLLNAWRLRIMRRFYDSVSTLRTSGEIVLTENGALWRTPNGASFFRWTAFSELFVTKDVWFLIVDRGSALWFDQHSAEPERAAIDAFLKEKIAVQPALS